MSMMALKNDYTVESKNKEKKPLRRSLLKFAVEKEQPTVAHVKLLLCNNSNHQLQWILKCTDNAIKAEPTMSGHIGMFGTDQVNLMWQRPKNISMWTDMPSPKLQLFIKLIAVTTGAEVTDGSAKFKAVINPEAECTINDLPIHKIIFNSETISERSTNDESNLKNDIDSETDHPKGFLENPDMLFWLIVIVCCFLGAIILQSLDDEYRGPRKHNYD